MAETILRKILHEGGLVDLHRPDFVVIDGIWQFTDDEFAYLRSLEESS